MSAKKLIELIERKGLLDASIIADLRQQVSQSKYKVSPESVAKILVDKGHLTRFQATKLVGEVTAENEQTRKQESPPPKKQNEEEELGLAPDEDELGLAPDEDEQAATEEAEEVVMLEAAEDEPPEVVGGLTPVEDAGGGLTPIGGPVTGLTPIAESPRPLGADLGGLAPGDDSGLDPFAEDHFQRPAPQTMVAPRKPLRGFRQRWDTKLILGGILALGLMVVLGVWLLNSLLKTPAVEMFNAAEEAYRSESYSDAIAKYEKFLKNYPGDDNASKARVRIGLARMRLAVSEPNRGLEVAKQVLPAIQEEPAFGEAREELAGILPLIPEGFTNRAKLIDDMAKAEELLKLATEGMGLVENPTYLPTSVIKRVLPTVNRIKEDMDLVRRAINQDKDLKDAIKRILAAVGADDTAGAYAIYKGLLDKYPGLYNDKGLLEAVLRITERQRNLTKVEELPLAALKEDVPSASEYRIVLASRSGEGASRGANQVALAAAGGSVYGLDAGTGRVLWRRFVGYGTHFRPARLSDQADADVLLVDGQRNELVRVRAKTGELAWRLPVGEPLADAVIAGTRIVVVTESGLLLEVDPDKGDSSRRVSIPQPLSLSPGVASAHQRMFQVAEHSNLYALSTETLQCEEVFYLGHKEGSVVVPPVALLGHLFVAENAGSDYSLLHIISLKSRADGPSLRRPQSYIRLKGNVVVPMVVYGRRLLVVTDRGAIRVFDVDAAKEQEPVSDAAALVAARNEPIVSYPLTDAGTLWMADSRLTKYQVQVTTKEVSRKSVTNEGDTFVGPLQLFGDVLVHVRRLKDSAGVAVTAVHIDDPRRPLWQTHLGAPAECVSVDTSRGEIRAISATASLFEITKDALASGYQDQPAITARSGGPSLSFTDQVELGEGRIALFNPADHWHVLVYDPSQPSGRLRVVELKPSGGSVSCVPVALQGGLLTPLDTGEILLWDLRTGGPQALPFQPRLEPGESIGWRGPAVVGTDATEFVIADDRRNLYRVSLKDKPQPVLAELAKVRLDVQIASSLAAAGDTVYGVARSSGGDVIVAIGLADLKVGQQWNLNGRVTWGPERVGDAVFFVSDAEGLLCYESGQKQRWTTPIGVGQPAGRPIEEGGDFIFASLSGAVWRISGATGKELNRSEVGEPLATGPVVFGERLLLCGNDGALYVIPMLAGS